MPAELDAIAAWTLVAECPIPNDIGPILVPGEQPYVAYKTFRDSAIFTDRRLIVRDSQGITGKKVELYSLAKIQRDDFRSRYLNFFEVTKDSNASQVSSKKALCLLLMEFLPSFQTFSMGFLSGL